MDADGVWIGIDVATEGLDIAIDGAAAPWRVATDAAGVDALVADLAGRAPRLIVIEPTGGLETAAVAALLEAGLPVAVVNPARVRAFAAASGQRATTDALDARRLAACAARIRPPARPLPDATTAARRGILARRRPLGERRVAEEHRRPTLAGPLVARRDEHVAWVRAQIADRDAEAGRVIAASPAWQAKAARLGSIPGVGTVVARALLAARPELGTRTGREAAALAGVAPRNRDAGRTSRPRRCAGGRAGVRATRSRAAMTAARGDPEMRAFAARRDDRGKPGTVVLVACMRKLLLIAHAVLRDGVPWTPRGAAMA